MIAVYIPAEDSSSFTMSTTFDGVEFEFRFAYNGREDRWYFDLARDGTPIRKGAKVVCNHVYEVQATGGRFVFVGNKGVSPGWGQLGVLVNLFYASANEVAP